MRFKMKNGKRVYLPESNKDDVKQTQAEELPNFQKMTKKALGEWAKEKGIVVDAKQTKANMIEDIKIQL
tara:strand:+ start:302 stop:508 length:207 start_codon:yes stop_codon:yes gene_type:complete